MTQAGKPVVSGRRVTTIIDDRNSYDIAMSSMALS